MATASDARKTWETQAAVCAQHAASLRTWAAFLEAGEVAEQDVIDLAGENFVPCTAAVLARFEKALRTQADAVAEFRRELIRAAQRIKAGDAAANEE
jgi:hypothetical protein